MSLKYCPQWLIYNTPSLVQGTAWRHTTNDKPILFNIYASIFLKMLSMMELATGRHMTMIIGHYTPTH